MTKFKELIRKSIFKWIIGIFSVFLILLIILIVLITTSPGENFLRRIAERQLQKTLGQQVVIGGVETNLLTRLQLSHVKIFKTDGLKSTSFLDLGYTRIDYQLWHLFKRKFSIKSIIIDSLQLNVVKDSSGMYNLPLFETTAKKETQSKPSKFKLILDNVNMNNFLIQYNDRTIPLKGSLNNFNFTFQTRDTDEYQFRMQIDSGKLEYLERVINTRLLNIEGVLKDKLFHLEKLSYQLPGLTLTGNALVNIETDPYSMSGNLNIQGNPNPIIETFQDMFPFDISVYEGDFKTSIDLKGTIREPQINFHIKFPDFSLSNVLLKEGTISGEYKAEKINLSKLQIQLLRGNIVGKGQIALDTLLTHNFALSINRINLSDIWKIIYDKASPYEGFINGKIESGGPLKVSEELWISSQISTIETKYHSKKIQDFNNRIEFNKGVAKFELQQANSRIETLLYLKEEEVNGRFSANIFNLEPLIGFLNISEFKGTIGIDGTISGKLNKPELIANISGRKIYYQNFPVDTLFGHMSYKDNQVYLEKFLLTGALTTIDTLNPIFHLSNLRGGISYQCKFKGTVDNLEGELTAQLSQPVYQDVWLDSINLKMTLTDKQGNIDFLRLHRDSLLIDLTGEYLIPSKCGNLNLALLSIFPEGQREMEGRPYTHYGIIDSIFTYKKLGNIYANFDISDRSNWFFEMKGNDIRLQELPILHPKQMKIGGNLNYNFEFTGNLDNPSSNMQISIDSLQYEQVFLDLIRAKFRLHQDRFYFEPIEVFMQKNKTLAKGEIELKKTPKGTYEISDKNFTKGIVEADSIDLIVLKPLLKNDFRITGNSTFRLEWEGIMKRPRIQGEFQIQNAELQVSPETISIQAIQVKALIQDSLFNLEDLSGKFQEIPFKLNGSIKSSDLQRYYTQINLFVSNLNVLNGSGTIEKDSLNINLNIEDFDLSFIKGFTSELQELKGTLNSKLFIEGNPSNPNITGNLKINNLAFQSNLLNTPLTDGVIDVNFNRNRINLDSLVMHLNKGLIYASGSLAQIKGELTELNIKSSITDININRPKEYMLEINSAQFTYQKKDDHYELDGDVVLGENRFIYNFQPKSILSYFNTIERPYKTPPLIVQQTRLNIRIRESENLWIDNNLTRLRLHPELSVIGYLSQPNITGRLSIEEGYILYLDRRFQIQQGIMDFVDYNRLNPVIDFKAAAKIKSYQTLNATPYIITIAISGDLDKLKVELTSEPPLDNSDIISLLTVGATREQLTGKDTGGETTTVSEVLKRRISTISSQKISNYAARNIGNFFGLDEMSIEGDLFNFGNTWGPQLLASKKISNRMEITYTTTVGHLNEQRIRLNYLLSKYFSVMGETDQRGQSGMDLKYRLKFE